MCRRPFKIVHSTTSESVHSDLMGSSPGDDCQATFKVSMPAIQHNGRRKQPNFEFIPTIRSAAATILGAWSKGSSPKKPRVDTVRKLLEIDSESFLPQMAVFDRSELVLGAMTGKGAFCEVHEIQDVCLKAAAGNDCINKQLLHPFSFKLPTQSNNQEVYTQEQKRAREHLRKAFRRTNNDSDEDNPTVDRHTSCLYVVKFLRPNLVQERGYKVFTHAAADLVMEYDILSRLSHPNIVRLVGGGNCKRSAKTSAEHDATGRTGSNSGQIIASDEFFIVLERLKGTLSQRIQEWKKSDYGLHINEHQSRDNSQEGVAPGLECRYIERLRYARDIACALAYLHKRDFVYRDLKPDNIMFSLDGSIKLVDFGLCRDLPKPDDTPSLLRSQSQIHGEPVFKMSGVGTRRYMAPEVILGQRYNRKVDCYSWAMVFFEMMSLEKPFASYNRSAHRIVVCEHKERPCIPSDMPFDARSLLNRAWQQDPCDRLSAQQIYDELDHIIECAERKALTPLERSLKVVMEMADLLTLEDFGNDNRTESSIFVSGGKSTADLTTGTCSSTSVTATAESIL
jgi:serine/threonine protein kinase